MALSRHPYSVAIACGGTGGHLFPGLAIAEKLHEQQSHVTLVVSQKEVDQQAIKNETRFQVLPLPAVGLQRGKLFAFLRGFRESFLVTKRLFRLRPPDAVIGMGGFTSTAPIHAGRALGACTFLHESNTIPGRANRWLSRVVDQAFVGFPSAARKLQRCRVTVTGTPVRPLFHQADAASCRTVLGLDPERPVMLVTGGSQGAGGINKIVERSLPLFSKLNPEWQWFHLTGTRDADRMKQVYAKLGLSAVVHPFFNHVELALGAATAAISRAGASSLAEIAVIGVPSLLIPYPAATDNHQWHNAQAYLSSGAGQCLEEKQATPERVTASVRELVQNPVVRQSMQAALAEWERPHAASEIALAILDAIKSKQNRLSTRRALPTSSRKNPFAAESAPAVARRSHQEQPARL
jgi:UDP-N-acetylglucosamine--N-acetylmuramyl-(pentapeptide) pyrophosphoryl-undecaprenol N-acetylglucosamine transferase